MADTLVRLAGPAALTDSAATVYTVPALTSAVMRNIHVTNETGTTRTFTMSIGTDGAGKRVFYAVPVLPGDPFDWSGNIPMVAAEVVQAYASAASALTLVVGGIETA